MVFFHKIYSFSFSRRVFSFSDAYTRARARAHAGDGQEIFFEIPLEIGNKSRRIDRYEPKGTSVVYTRSFVLREGLNPAFVVATSPMCAQHEKAVWTS